MANENTPDSGKPHVVLNILHPNGDTHSVAVPADTNLSDLHSSLAQDYVHPELNDKLEAAAKQPDPEGVLEKDENFKAAARKAYSAVSYGDLQQESGFTVNNRGQESPVVMGQEIRPNEMQGSTKLHFAPDTFASLHVHPKPTMNKNWTQQPSEPDRAVARSTRTATYVVSSTGLWSVQPDGSVQHVFDNSNWMKAKKK
jgi:hypothetical protein